MSDVLIKSLSENTLTSYIDYLHEHMSESGLNGNLVYTPFPLNFEHPKELMLKNIGDNIKKRLNESRWERVFLAFKDEKIIAHAAIKGHYLEAALHRCELGLGMLPEARSKGLGLKMMQIVIQWLKNDTELIWLDLSCFSHNTPALKLYTKLGFVNNGTMKDMFRVDGQSIDDHKMTLRLR